jgi:hypothetical protein
MQQSLCCISFVVFAQAAFPVEMQPAQHLQKRNGAAAEPLDERKKAQ